MGTTVYFHLSTLTGQSLWCMNPCCQQVGLLLVFVWYYQRPGQQGALVEQSWGEKTTSAVREMFPNGHKLENSTTALICKSPVIHSYKVCHLHSTHYVMLHPSFSCATLCCKMTNRWTLTPWNISLVGSEESNLNVQRGDGEDAIYSPLLTSLFCIHGAETISDKIPQ